MSKRNIFLRIGVLMLIATLATSGVFVGSGTYAKYVASKGGNAKARVAHFHVEVSDRDFSGDSSSFVGEFSNATHTAKTITASGDLGILLQPTISAGAWGTHPGGPGSGTVDLDTISAVDGSIIAPGTGGRLSFVFTNRSEVSVRFWLATVSTTVESIANLTKGLTVNEIKFAYDNGSGTAPALSQFGTLAAALGSYTTQYVELGPWNGTGSPPSAAIGVYWQWPFEQSPAQNTQDTILGEDAQNTSNAGLMEMILKIRAQQVD